MDKSTFGALDEALSRAKDKRRLPPPQVRRFLRQRTGVSQEALAAALGVKRPTITRWEAGQREPRGDHLLAYLSVLDRLASEGQR